MSDLILGILLVHRVMIKPILLVNEGSCVAKLITCFAFLANAIKLLSCHY